MDKKRTRALLTDLIQMDIVNCKLVKHLDEMGIDIHAYALGIERVVFGLMDLEDRPDTDEIFERYMTEHSVIMNMDIKRDIAKIEQLAKSLYETLDFYAQQDVARELPEDTREQIKAGRASYRECNKDGKHSGLFLLKIHGIEYVVTQETLNWFDKSKATVPHAT